MTAYLTGEVGECEVGEDMVEELPISFDNIQHVPDDHGCHRPTSCWMEPKSGQYNAVAIFFETRPTQEQIDFIKERVKTFDHAYKTKGRMAEFNKNNPEIKILGFRLEKFESKPVVTENI